MAETVKIPYGDGFADAVAVELPPVHPTFDIALPDGKSIKVELRVMNVFRLLDKTDEKGEPIFLFSVQLRTETEAKPKPVNDAIAAVDEGVEIQDAS